MMQVKVYLAGGMRTGWQDKVKEECKDLFDQGLVEWKDPRDNKTSDPKLYGPLDRYACDDSRIFFGFAEKSNPLPFPLFMEMGYCLGQENKVIIFVNEIEDSDPRSRPMLFAKVFGCGHVLMEKELDEGIKLLKQFITILSNQ